MSEPHSEYLYSLPHVLRFIDSEGKFSIRPFVYRMEAERDPKTLRFVYEENKDIQNEVHSYYTERKNPQKLLQYRVKSILLLPLLQPGCEEIFATSVV
ncbi:hypothetical protein ES707_21688 [subsurface metagenome]